jgi:hypothetical protein
MSDDDAAHGVKWEPQTLTTSMIEQYLHMIVDGKFVGILGKYPGCWLLTMVNDKGHVELDADIPIDEAKATAALIWRMER